VKQDYNQLSNKELLVVIAKSTRRIERKLGLMSVELDDLQEKVTKTEGVEDSAIVLLQGLSSQIAALKNDPAALQALSTRLNSKADDLAAAITATGGS
jgi:hypothetical protein